MGRLNELDRKMLDSMTGRQKLDVLLVEAGFQTRRSLALVLGESADEVSRCLIGRKDRWPTMDRIRSKVAGKLTLTRAEIDELLDDAVAEAVS